MSASPARPAALRPADRARRWVRRHLPVPALRGARALLHAARETRSGAWLEGVPVLGPRIRAARRASMRRFLEDLVVRSAHARSQPLPGRAAATVLTFLEADRLFHATPSAAEALSTDVLYLTGAASPDAIKDVVALRRVDRRVHVTLLAGTLGHVEAECLRHFDAVRLFRHNAELVGWLRAARARTLVVRRGVHIAQAVLARLAWDGRLVYRPYDFMSRHPIKVPLGDMPGLDAFETERWVLETADAMYHFHVERAIESLREAGVRFRGPVASIQPAIVLELGPRPRPKLSAEDGAVHVVCSSSIMRTGDTRSVGSAHFLDKWRAIAEQKVHLHVYVPHLTAADRTGALKPYFDLTGENPYFHLEGSKPYTELLDVLTQYDYALAHWDHSQSVRRPGFLEGTSNNVYDYLQAGLPLIVSPTTPALARMVRTHGVGVVVEEAEIGRLGEILRVHDATELARRVTAAAPVFQFDHARLWEVVLGDPPPSPAGIDEEQRR